MLRVRPVLILLALVTATSFLSVLLPLPAAGAQSSAEARLAEHSRRLAGVRAALESAAGQRSDAAGALQAAEDQLVTVLETVGQAQLAVQDQQEEVDGAARLLEALRQQALARSEVLRSRAADLYKQGSQEDSLSTMLASDTPQEALERSGYAAAATRSDRRELEEASASQVSVDAQRQVLEVEKATLTRVLEQQQALQAEAEELQQSRQLQLAAASERVLSLQVQEDHLVEEEAQIAEDARQAAAVAAQAAAERAAAGQLSTSEASAGSGSSAAAPSSSSSSSGSSSSGSSSSGSSSSGSSSGAERSSPPAPVAAAPEPEAAPAIGGGGFRWPARGVVTSGFGQRGGRLHAGIDIGVPIGTSVSASKGGTVSFAGVRSGYGNCVMIAHGDGFTTLYAHLSRIGVAAGQSVSGGQVIAASGNTGRSTGPHLHFEIRINGAPKNPRNYLP